jgi:hypothetical protein
MREWKYLGIGVPVRGGKGVIVGIYEVSQLGDVPKHQNEEIPYLKTLKPQISFVVERE